MLRFVLRLPLRPHTRHVLSSSRVVSDSVTETETEGPEGHKCGGPQLQRIVIVIVPI